MRHTFLDISVPCIALLIIGATAACGPGDLRCREGLVAQDGQCVPGGVPGGDAGPPQPTGAVEGGPCGEEGTLSCGDNAAGTSDDTALYCEAGVYSNVFECPGLQGCFEASADDWFGCGTTQSYIPYAIVGAPCAAEGAAVCSLDRSIIAFCTSGVWEEAQHCPPSECTLTDTNTVGCANGGITLGDRCQGNAGAVTCSTDLRYILACEDGTAVVHTDCGTEQQCTLFEGGGLGCG